MSNPPILSAARLGAGLLGAALLLCSATAHAQGITQILDAVYVSGYDSNNLFKIEPSGAISLILDGNVFRVNLPGGEVRPECRLGAKLVGGIDGAEGVADTDEFSFYATEGTRLTLVARPTGKGAVIKGVLVETTGLQAVSPSGLDGSTGTYRVKTRGKFPSNLNEIVEVVTDGGSVMFDGVPGMVAKTLRIKALAPKGAFATVAGEAADLRPKVTAAWATRR